jgi:hypothetical protein
VTAAVLRAARGHVRCGVCDASFDALGFLTDGIETEHADRARPTWQAADSAAAPTPLEPEPFGVDVAAEVEPPAAPSAVEKFTGDPDQRQMLAAIAASLAHTKDEIARSTGPGDGEEDEENVLEPADVENIILGGEPDGPEDASDADLEFNLPADHWDQIFVPDRFARTITPLDINLEPPEPAEPPEDERPPDMGAETSDHLRALNEFDDPLARTDEWEVPSQDDLEAAFASREEPSEPEPAPTESAADTLTADGVFLTAAAREAFEGFAAAPVLATRVASAASGADEPAMHTGDTETEPLANDDFAVEFGPRRRAVEGPAWFRPVAIAASALLTLALGAQVVHSARESLVSSPLVGPPLTRLYAALGRTLEPRWNLAAYDVKQWGAESAATPGGLRLRASVVNRAARGQPYPLLRVTLEDRFGGKVARRDFAPAEYLPGRSAPPGLMAPGARADADLSLADPGSQAVGFELDVCLLRNGVLACGTDPTLAGG